MHALGHVAADQAPAGYGGRPSCRNAFHRRLGELDHHHAGADDSSSAQLYYWLLSGLGRSWESNRALVILTPVFSATWGPGLASLLDLRIANSSTRSTSILRSPGKGVNSLLIDC